jgi:predicted short-subunit dehydrogenase-like oxidoreductase (DUF2520 family)
MKPRSAGRRRVRTGQARPIAIRKSPIASRKHVGVIGAGRVGCALAWHCRRLGYTIAGVADLKPKQAWVVYGLLKQPYEHLRARAVAAASDVLFLTVPDRSIGPVYESVRRWLLPGAIVAHCSGAFGPEVFTGAKEQGLGTLALHPVQSFASHSQAIRSLPGSFFAADGSASGLRFARRLVRQLRGSVVLVRGPDRPLYHTMCVFASNFIFALFDAAEEIASELGISRKRAGRMLEPLARTALDNIVEQGAGPSLTGPVERGDAVTVEKHLRTLSRRTPGLVPAYALLSTRLVEMARRRGLDRRAAKQLMAVLGGPMKHQ